MALSADRPRKSANFLTWRIYWYSVLGLSRRIVMSSISRRRNGLMALSVIGGLLSWVRSSAPRSQDRTPASATPRDPSLAANYRGSGLVHRRFSRVRVFAGEGLLAEPIAGPQLQWCELVFMPPLPTFTEVMHQATL